MCLHTKPALALHFRSFTFLLFFLLFFDTTLKFTGAATTKPLRAAVSTVPPRRHHGIVFCPFFFCLRVLVRYQFLTIQACLCVVLVQGMRCLPTRVSGPNSPASTQGPSLTCLVLVVRWLCKAGKNGNQSAVCWLAFKICKHQPAARFHHWH